MATQYTSILKLALPVQGELDGTWGDTVNDSITSMVEEAIAGRKVINTWTTNSHTLTTADGATSESRAAILSLTDTGAALTGAGTVICPAASKIYIVENGTGQSITVKTSSGTGVAVPDGTNMVVFCDGTNVEEGITNINSLTISGDTTISGNATISGTGSFSDDVTVTGSIQVDANNNGPDDDTGVFVKDAGASTSSPIVRVQGQRGDANVSQSFAGGLLLNKLRSDANVASGQHVGTVYFGGNHTDGTEANVAFGASISGLATGAYSSASDMPTGLVFYTGSTGVTYPTANTTTGTEAMRINEDQQVMINTTSSIGTGSRLSIKASEAYGSAISIESDNSANNWARINFKNVSAPTNAQEGIIFFDQGSNFALRNNNSSGTAAKIIFMAGDTTAGQTEFWPQSNPGGSVFTVTGDKIQMLTGSEIEHTAITSSSNAATIDLNDGDSFTHDLTENVTYTFSNPAPSGRATAFILKVIQDATARTITWPTSVDWAGGTAPTLSTGDNDVDIFVFYTNDGGTTYYGSVVGQDFA